MAAVTASSSHRGAFTLMEMLVVIAIIATLAGMAVFSMGGDVTRRLPEEAHRLQQAMQMAADEAVYQGKMTGMVITANNYGFVRYEHGWHPMRGDAYRLPASMQLTLTLQQPVRLPSGKPSAKTIAPAIIFMPSGEMTPFRLSLTAFAKTAPVVLVGDGVSPIGYAHE